MLSTPPSAVGTSLKFAPFTSVVSAQFWHSLLVYKLNTLKLDDDPLPIRGYYDPSSRFVHFTDVFGSSVSNFEKEAGGVGDTTTTSTHTTSLETYNERCYMNGTLKLFNTKEEFRSLPKQRYLWENRDKEVICIAFADLKEHKVWYWFAYPARKHKVPPCVLPAPSLMDPAPLSSSSDAKTRSTAMTSMTPTQAPAPSQFAAAQGEPNQGCLDYELLGSSFNQLRVERFKSSKSTGMFRFFAYDSSTMEMYPLEFPSFTVVESCANTEERKEKYMDVYNLIGDRIGRHDFYIGVVDTVDLGSSSPGWPARQLLDRLTDTFECCSAGSLEGPPGPTGAGEEKRTIELNLISYRSGRLRRLDAEFESVLLNNHHEGETSVVSLTIDTRPPNSPLEEVDTTNFESMVVGYETPQNSNRATPQLANLSSIMSPTLLSESAVDLNLKLMRWRAIPSLDPPLLQRQRCLLVGAGTLGTNVARTLIGWGVRNVTFLDCGRVRYSNPVRQTLFENADAEHGGKPKAQAAADALARIFPGVKARGVQAEVLMPGHSFDAESFATLKGEIENADTVFLLTDTRESRWLPTVISRSLGKRVINCALGGETWLVMRHGRSGDGLGCYFCSDVVAPDNSTNNRTLDQQCTVTRPGLAPIASAMGVEFFVAWMHEIQTEEGTSRTLPLSRASHESNNNKGDNKMDHSHLGVVPHQIRGSLRTYEMHNLRVPRFCHCTGCGDAIISAYESRGSEFVQSVCRPQGVEVLGEVSGLNEFLMGGKIEGWDDEQFDDGGDDF